MRRVHRTTVVSERLESTACVIAASGRAARLRPVLGRLGWSDKPTLPIGGLSLLERNVAAMQLAGVRTVLITLPPASVDATDEIRLRHVGLDIIPIPLAIGTSQRAFRDALNQLDRGRFDRALLLYGDVLPHVEALATVLYGPHDRAVVVARRRGDGGMRLSCDAEGRVLSASLDYSRHGRYPVAWLFDLADLEALNAQPDPNIDRLFVEHLAESNWVAVEAHYPRSLGASFNLNDPHDHAALSRLLEKDQMPFGYPGSLDAGARLVATLRKLGDPVAVDRFLASRRSLGSSSAHRRDSHRARGVFSACAVLLAGATAAAAMAAPFLALAWTTGSPLAVAASIVAILCASALAPYAAMNLRIAARVLLQAAPATRPCDLPDARLPRLSVVVPARNEPVEVVRRTLDRIASSDYPHDRLEVILVSGAAAGEPRTHDVAYRALVAAHPFMRMREVDYEPGLVNGKARSLNSVFPELNGDYVNLCDADTFYAAPDLRHMVARAERIREDSGDSMALVQFARRVDPEALATGSYLALLRHYLHDVVVDRFVTPERFELGFPGGFGHALLLRRTAGLELANEEPRGNLFEEEQRIEDLDLSFRLEATGRFTVHFANDVAVAEGIPLTWPDRSRRLAALVAGDTRLLLHWASRLRRSGRLSLANRVQIGLHLFRGLASLALCLLVVSPLALSMIRADASVHQGFAALAIALLLLVLPSLGTDFGQPVIVLAAAVKLCARRERRRACELVLIYPLLFLCLLATNATVAWSAWRAVVYSRREPFSPTPKSLETPAGQAAWPAQTLIGLAFAMAASVSLAMALVQSGFGWLLACLAAYTLAGVASRRVWKSTSTG